MKIKLLIAVLFIVTNIQAQFAPAVGVEGTTAIYKDSSIFSGWATNCSIIRGLQDLSDANYGYASVGDSSLCIGMAGDGGVASLGDNGTAIVTFNQPIINVVGWDFAVFENAFDDYFLELAYVYVSSDGVNYYRFPSTSNTQDTIQIGSFDLLDATKLNNLAGKYRALYGTPFDLEELNNIDELDVNNITHVKVQDVVGTINNSYANYDQNGNKINDPWPTPFPSSGFDLDAVGVINQSATNFTENKNKFAIDIYPNPAIDKISVKTYNSSNNKVFDLIEIKDVTGKIVFAKKNLLEKSAIDVSILKKGIYLVYIQSGSQQNIKKLMLQ
jgi:Secretion system C-terminal sorting domain